MYLENSQDSEGYYCLTIIVFDEHHIYLFNNHYNFYILKTIIIQMTNDNSIDDWIQMPGILGKVADNPLVWK